MTEMPLDSTISAVRHPSVFPHQVTGADFLAARGVAILADEPGSGKTRSLVRACDIVAAKRILIACPAAVRPTWHKEFANNQVRDRPITLCDGFARTTPGDGVTVVSHASFADPASVAAMKAGAPYDVVAFDEFHLFRHLDAARTRNVLSPDGAWTWGRRFWGLTGTPIVNSACDLWPFVHGPLRRTTASWYDWGVKFCEEMRSDGQGGIRPIGLRNERELAAFLRPHVLRRTLEGIGIKLPPLEIKNVALAIDPGALARAAADLEGWNPTRLAAALDAKDELKDAALARARRALGMAKVGAVAEHVHRIASAGEGPVVVFFQHTAVREWLHANLSGNGLVVSWIDGKVTPSQVNAAETWFQAGKLDVLLVQAEAGGVGLTLHRSNRVVVAELPWTAVALWQCVKRCHRIGSSRQVLAEVIRASGCWMEEALANAVGRKHRASEKLLSLLETNS